MMEEILEISTTGDRIFYRTPRDRILNIYYIIIFILFIYFFVISQTMCGNPGLPVKEMLSPELTLIES